MEKELQKIDSELSNQGERPLLAYMAINIDFDDNKPHVFIKKRFINYAFIIRKCRYGI